MRPHFILAFLFVYSLLSAQKPKPYDPNKKFSVSELQFDLAILKDALVKVHPGLFWYQSEKDFEERYSRLRNSISSPMTEKEFNRLIKPFIGEIRCSHTNQLMSKDFDAWFFKNIKLFPFLVRIISPKLYLRENYSGDSSLVMGSEIVSINGLKADSLIAYLRPFTWGDGFVTSYAGVEYDFAPLLLILGVFNDPDKYVLNIIDPKGQERTIEIPALEQNTIEQRWEKAHRTELSKDYKPFHFQLFDSLSTALLRLEVFEGKGFPKFLKQSFDTLQSKNIKNLVIDLRENGGGQDDYGKLFYSYITTQDFKYYDHLEVCLENLDDSIFTYGKFSSSKRLMKYYQKHMLTKIAPGKYELKTKAHPNLSEKPFPPQKNNFKGNVYVLIDDKSFSATSEFCALAQFNKRAKFIGRETGGGYCGNTSGDEFVLTLPHTGLRVFIPYVKYYSAVEGSCGRGIVPNYFVKDDVSNFLSKQGSDLLYTLELIRKTQ